MNEEKILIFTSREICYNSHFFFARQMGDAFEKKGYEVEYCEFTPESDFDEVLRPHLGQSYKLMLDFNSRTFSRRVLFSSVGLLSNIATYPLRSRDSTYSRASIASKSA